MKKLLIVTIAALCVAPATASAFTLHQAHRLAVRTERTFFHGSRVGSCRWAGARHRAADCSVTSMPLVVLVGGIPTTYVWTDVVTRSGPCLTHVVRWTGPHSGIAAGGGYGNCFTGPLVVLRRSLRIG
jgi:hypothetical protein